MTGSTKVLSALQADLIGAGLVRKPGIVGTLPPLHVEPDDGPLSPGDTEDQETSGLLVVTARLSTTAPSVAGTYVRKFVIDLVYRSITTKGLIQARRLDDAIYQRLIETAGYGTGVMLNEGGPDQTFCLSIENIAGLGDLGNDDEVRVQQTKYLVEVNSA